MNTIETSEENHPAPRELETEGKSLEQIRDIVRGAAATDTAPPDLRMARSA